MELLKFRGLVCEILNIKKTSDVGTALLNAVLTKDISIYEKFNTILTEDKDWLQSLWQYYEADRTEKKQDYTPKSICKLVAELSGEYNSIYDCCGGSGALTIELLKKNPEATVLVEELDDKVIPFLLFNLCMINASGYVINSNVLTGEKYKGYKLTRGEKYSACEIVADYESIPKKYDIAISNPPYNIKWQAPLLIETDERFPITIPESNANYAFVFNCLHKSDNAVLILPNGVLSHSNETSIREYLSKNNIIDTIVTMPEKMFEATAISTCIMVLNKNKKQKEIRFIDSRKNCIQQEREQNGQFGGASHTCRTYKKIYNSLTDENIQKILYADDNIVEFSAMVSNEKIRENKYNLIPSLYIEHIEQEQQHRPFQEIADNLNYIIRMQNNCKLVINETIAKGLGLDIETFKNSKEKSKELREQMIPLGYNIEDEDYIQFTKNKNEFVFKCNDKELIPDILLQFFNVWKNQIALLNTMQNQYLSELRDALLPDLMSGKIEL